jgi:hypothetical protein
VEITYGTPQSKDPVDPVGMGISSIGSVLGMNHEELNPNSGTLESTVNPALISVDRMANEDPSQLRNISSTMEPVTKSNNIVAKRAFVGSLIGKSKRGKRHSQYRGSAQLDQASYELSSQSSQAQRPVTSSPQHEHPHRGCLTCRYALAFDFRMNNIRLNHHPNAPDTNQRQSTKGEM